MRESKFGKETAFLWEGWASREQLLLEEVASSFDMSRQDEERVAKAFEEAKAKNPHFFDGTLWRYECTRDVRGGNIVDVSPINYSRHNVLRYEQGKPIEFYPNPVSINAVQETVDGYLLIGVKGKVADQKGLGVMGAGFIKRKLDAEGESLPPESVFTACERECLEETAYSVENPFDAEELVAMGAIFGSNHDTTFSIYVPLNASSKEVDLGNQEHSDLILLPTDIQSLETFLGEGAMRGMPAADHLLGCVELYMENKYHYDRI